MKEARIEEINEEEEEQEEEQEEGDNNQEGMLVSMKNSKWSWMLSWVLSKICLVDLID